MEEQSDNNYAALANAIKIEEITSCEQNRDILQRIKDNDSTLTELSINDIVYNSAYYNIVYIPRGENDLGWLGYYIGQNTTLRKLSVDVLHGGRNNTDSFYRELSHNRSIREITMHFVGGRMFQMMDLFFKNNSNLTDIGILRGPRSDIFDDHFFSRELKNYTKSLRRLRLACFDQAIDIITSLNMHPQLEEIGLGCMDIGSNGCMVALSTLLPNQQKLYLKNTNIDDQGIDSLILAIKLSNVSSISQLRELTLSYNRSVTMRGWTQVASLLELPDCNLKVLGIGNNNLGDDGARIFVDALVNNSSLKKLQLEENGITNEVARIFADALTNNSTLKTLDLGGNDITTEGWAPFKKLLCDTSSVNNTYLSNHTLQNVGWHGNTNVLEGYLNEIGGEKIVAMAKILRHHSHFDVQPFFVWELKVLPLLINWFTKAADCTTEYEEKIRRMTLDTMYDFIKAFPMLYIWSMTMNEISGCIILEEKLRQEGRTSSTLKQLATIREFKARALRRLSLPPTSSEEQDGAMGAEFSVEEASSARQADENNEISTTRRGDGGESLVFVTPSLNSSNSISILSDDPLESITESDEESEGGSGASSQATLEARDAKDTTDSSSLATRRQLPLTTVPYKGSESEAASHSNAVVATGKLSASTGLGSAIEDNQISRSDATARDDNHQNNPLPSPGKLAWAVLVLLSINVLLVYYVSGIDLRTGWGI